MAAEDQKMEFQELLDDWLLGQDLEAEEIERRHSMIDLVETDKTGIPNLDRKISTILKLSSSTHRDVKMKSLDRLFGPARYPKERITSLLASTTTQQPPNANNGIPVSMTPEKSSAGNAVIPKPQSRKRKANEEKDEIVKKRDVDIKSVNESIWS